MTKPLFELSEQIRQSGAIGPAETLALRRLVWPDGEIGREEANVLFELNDVGHDRSPEWVEFFVNAICAHVVTQTEPRGYVSEEDADWLIRRIDHDGRLDSMIELELIAEILERAKNAPDRLKNYALQQIEHAVVHGDGPTRDGSRYVAGSINGAEVALLHRILYARAGHGPAAVSRDEADMLFRIKDATVDGNNAPEWQTLFVNALRQHLLESQAYAALSRGEAARLESFMDDNRPNIGGFFGRMAKSALSGDFVEALRAEHHTPTSEVADDMVIDKREQEWLQAKIDADQNLDRYERALLKALAEEDWA